MMSLKIYFVPECYYVTKLNRTSLDIYGILVSSSSEPYYVLAVQK